MKRETEQKTTVRMNVRINALLFSHGGLTLITNARGSREGNGNEGGLSLNRSPGRADDGRTYDNRRFRKRVNGGIKVRSSHPCSPPPCLCAAIAAASCPLSEVCV